MVSRDPRVDPLVQNWFCGVLGLKRRGTSGSGVDDGTRRGFLSVV